MFKKKQSYIFLKNGLINKEEISYIMPYDGSYMISFKNGDKVPITEDVVKYIEHILGKNL